MQYSHGTDVPVPVGARSRAADQPSCPDRGYALQGQLSQSRVPYRTK